MDDRWERLSVREGWIDGDILHEGIPAHLLDALRSWVSGQFPSGNAGLAQSQLTDIEVSCHVYLGSKTGKGKFNRLMDKAETEPREFLTVLDYLVSIRDTGSSHIWALDDTLYRGGSLWRVATAGDTPHLERRVGETMMSLGEQAMSPPTRAAKLLRSAWINAYGLNPQPSKAFFDAVKAVESVAKPVISPDDKGAHLGRMSNYVRDHEHEFTVLLEPVQGSAVAYFNEMLKLLWRSEFDRHGQDDEDVPIEVSREQAEAGVGLATVLVQWFNDGVFRRVTPAPS